jgi:hypothetical protein
MEHRVREGSFTFRVRRRGGWRTDYAITMNPIVSGNAGPRESTLDHLPRAPEGTPQSATKELAAAAKEQLKTASAEIKDTAQEAFQAAKGAGEDLFATQKHQLAGKLHAYRDALQAARGSLDQDDVKLLASPADRAIRALDRAETYLSNCDGKRLLGDAADLARRRPEWFFGALFLAGLAGGRFLKAATPKASGAPSAPNPSRAASAASGSFDPHSNLTTLP